MRSRIAATGLGVLLMSCPPLWAQFGSSAPPAAASNELIAEIVQRGYDKVGVLPRFVSRDGTNDAFHGDAAAHARLFSEQLADQLIAGAAGRFRVVDPSQMWEACKGMAIEDLGNRARLLEIANKVGGMKAIIRGYVDQQIGSYQPSVFLNVRYELIDVAESTRQAVAEQPFQLTLAGAALMGKSFELRRWEGKQLSPRFEPRDGTDPFTPIEFSTAAGSGIAELFFGENSCFNGQMMKAWGHTKSHPLESSSFPFPLEFQVDGAVRPLDCFIDKEPYLKLDPGERYAIRVDNKTEQNVYVAVFVDGVNVLGKKAESFANCRYWLIEAGSWGVYRGWYTGSDGKYSEEAFYIAQLRDTPGGKLGLTANLGMITTVFYTVGMPSQQQYRRPSPQYLGGSWHRVRDPATNDWTWAWQGPQVGSPGPGPTYATGVGPRTEVALQEFQGDKPGLILAAVTVRYRTSSQIEQLKQRTGANVEPPPRRRD